MLERMASDAHNSDLPVGLVAMEVAIQVEALTSSVLVTREQPFLLLAWPHCYLHHLVHPSVAPSVWRHTTCTRTGALAKQLTRAFRAATEACRAYHSIDGRQACTNASSGSG